MKQTHKNIVAVDVGGSGGKMSLFGFDGEQIFEREKILFKNEPLISDGRMLINCDSLFQSIQNGLSAFSSKSEIASVGIDTFGGGFAYVNGQGPSVYPIYNCRDTRTHEFFHTLSPLYDKFELYKRSGVPNRRHTVLTQLALDAAKCERAISDGNRALMLPAYLSYLLTGCEINDSSSAVDTCLAGANGLEWDQDIARVFGVPDSVFSKLCPVGGNNVAAEKLGSALRKLRVISVAGHDTMCAVSSIPNLTMDDCFISIGTTIIVGAATDGPHISWQAYKGGFKNAVGAFEKNYLCTDITGFWVAKRCFDRLNSIGVPADIDKLKAAAIDTGKNESFVDFTDPDFGKNTSDMIGLIAEKCTAAGMRPPETLGELGLCLFESFALAAAWSVKELLTILGKKKFRNVYVVSGATQNSLLMQYLANALSREVFAGIPTATLCGNALIQLAAIGEISGAQQTGEVAERISQLKMYKEENAVLWEHKRALYKKLRTGKEQ